MQTRTVERITRWPSQPFEGGYAGLRDLVEAEFDGAVHVGPWILLRRGHVVGVFDDSIENVASTGGTIYTSPEPSLPALFAMLEHEPEQSAHYHTDQTPLGNVTEALTERDFTGYLELSTDGGDEYFVVYDGSAPTSVAFVGTEDRLVRGAPADDVVSDVAGMYTVALTPVETVELPQTRSENQTLTTRMRTSQSVLADGSDESIEELNVRIAALERERDALKAERDDLIEERDRLEARIRQLKERVDRSETGTAATETRQELSREEALSETSLFVRYHTRSKPTLDDAYDGIATREEVNENIILERFTTFDAESVVVDGVPFEQFLTETLEYDVVSWLVSDLMYEIYDAGYEDDLGALYDALPAIDRASLHTSTTTDNGTSVSFDVVCFDEFGDPLLVVRTDLSHTSTTARETESFLDSASAVAGQWPLEAALLVTSSYFDGSAIDAAADATAGGGGLFSSGSRSSYVKLSRKNGYHLCLVEGRERQFHVAVPKI